MQPYILMRGMREGLISNTSSLEDDSDATLF